MACRYRFAWSWTTRCLHERGLRVAILRDRSTWTRDDVQVQPDWSVQTAGWTQCAGSLLDDIPHVQVQASTHYYSEPATPSRLNRSYQHSATRFETLYLVSGRYRDTARTWSWRSYCHHLGTTRFAVPRSTQYQAVLNSYEKKRQDGPSYRHHHWMLVVRPFWT